MALRDHYFADCDEADAARDGLAYTPDAVTCHACISRMYREGIIEKPRD